MADDGGGESSSEMAGWSEDGEPRPVCDGDCPPGIAIDNHDDGYDGEGVSTSEDELLINNPNCYNSDLRESMQLCWIGYM